jgi:hypothetical protein
VSALKLFLLFSSAIRSDAAQLPPAEARNLVEMICPGQAGASSCAVCPKEMAFSDQRWDVRSITFGHFVSPASEDVLVSGFGCESHAEGMSGSFLLTKDGAAWRKVRYLQGVNAFDCRKLAGSDGRHRLVCAADDTHVGVADTYLYLLDAGRDPATVDPLTEDYRGQEFFAVDDSLGGCVTYPKGFVQSGAIDRVEFTDLAAAHHARIVVFARLGKAAVPEDVLQKNCGYGQPGLKLATLPRRYEFIFDGVRVSPVRSNPPIHLMDAVAPRTSYSIGN